MFIKAKHGNQVTQVLLSRDENHLNAKSRDKTIKMRNKAMQ